MWKSLLSVKVKSNDLEKAHCKKKNHLLSERLRQPTGDLEKDDVDEQQFNGGNVAVVPEEAAAFIHPDKNQAHECPNLCKMISDHQWMNILELLSSKRQYSDLIVVEDGSVTRDLIVHRACMHGAPVCVVRSIASQYPMDLHCVDKSNRFPIHCAALNGADLDTLLFLINTNIAATRVQDALGKTPLHYICENYISKNKGGNSLKTQQDMFWVVGLLIKSAPSTVNIEDHQEMNPIEYAIASGAHIGVIREMQKASRNCWRARHKREGWKPHAEYAHYIQDQSSPASYVPTSPN